MTDRPTTDLVPESVLVGMEQNGWTPTQVRALIASYREVTHRLAVLDGSECQHCGIADRVGALVARLAKEARTAKREGLDGHAGTVAELVRVLRDEVLHG